MDEVTSEQLEQWMTTMSISMSSDHKARLLKNEKLRLVLKTLIKRVAPRDKVMHAKRLLLFKELLSLPTDETNSIDCSKQLQQLKRYSALKQKLKIKEDEFESKRKMYLELVKTVEDMMQKIQFASTALDEERQKVMLMWLNNKELQDRIRVWQTVQQDVYERKCVEEQKNSEENYEKMENTKIMDVLDDCQSYISKVLLNKTWDSSSSYKLLKQDMVKYVNGCIKGFHWKTIYEALLHSQKKLQDLIDKVEKTSMSDKGRSVPNPNDYPTTQKIFGDFSNATIFNIYMQNLGIAKEKGCGDGLSGKFPVQAEEIEKELKAVESRLAVVDEEIQKKIEEYKNFEPLIKNVAEMNLKICEIKQVSKLTKKFMKAANQYDVPFNELQINMNQLRRAARREVDLFAEIPLVFLESLHFPSGDVVTGYKLLSNFQKLLPFIKRNSKSSLPVLDGALNLAPYNVVVHLFIQLSYFKTLQLTESSLKQNNTSIVPFQAECFSDGSEKMQRMLNHFVGSLAAFEVNVDEVTLFLQTLWSHPLRNIIPSDYVVEGITYAEIAEMGEIVQQIIE